MNEKFEKFLSLCDPRYREAPFILSDTPNIRWWRGSGFMWWRGEYREINEIHETFNGKQIELIK